MRRLARALMLASLALIAGALRAQTASTPDDTNAKLRALQADLTSQHAAAIARERRLADEREEGLFAELDQRDNRLRALLRDLNRTQQERNSARADLAAVVAERSRFVEEIAGRDRAYAAEIAEFRRQIAGLAEPQNPALRPPCSAT